MLLETSNWLVVIYSGHQIAEPRMEPRDPQYKDALPQEGLAYGCSAIRPSPCNQAKETEHSRNSDSEVLYTRNAKKIKA
jgi:hypothetical protein